MTKFAEQIQESKQRENHVELPVVSYFSHLMKQNSVVTMDLLISVPNIMWKFQLDSLYNHNKFQKISFGSIVYYFSRPTCYMLGRSEG